MLYSPDLYIHELDKKALDVVNSFPKIVRLKKLYDENYTEKKAKIFYLSNAIRLGPDQMPEIYNLLPPICDKLGIDVPELYYVKDKRMNAFTGGTSFPYICVTSKLVEKIPTELIGSVLAHECGHIAGNHGLYHSIAWMLLDGVDRSPLGQIPGINRILTPSIEKAILFWYRCSELSADRAAVLCDGGADHTIDMLLKIHGYDDKINRTAFLEQALDLYDFVNESNINKMIAGMLNQDDTHPRLATRVYESYNWSQSEQFQQILDGTYTLSGSKESTSFENEEAISGEIVIPNTQQQFNNFVDVQPELDRINQKLDRYTSRVDKNEYALAVGAGIMAGILDAVYVGKIEINQGDINLSHEQVNRFIQDYAEERGIGKQHLGKAIEELEKMFKVAQDNTWKGAGIGVTPKNHHLADLSHHPTPLGLLSAIIVQFLRVGTFVNRNGEWHFLLVKAEKEDVIRIAISAIITALLNWIIYVNEKDYENETGREVPNSIKRLAHLVASTPILIEIAKCADNWFGHLVSDMGGSKNTAGGGMGIPGVFISLLYEIAALPILKDTSLPLIVNNLYEKQKIDFRHELAALKAAKKQVLPVIFMDALVRVLYFAAELGKQSAVIKASGGTLKDINWHRVIPFNDRSIDRMLTVASMTFTVADTADAAVHAAIESGGNLILFAGNFVTRFNYIGAGRAAFAIIKEISSEKKEAELIHQKLLLTDVKTAQIYQQIEDYKVWLEEKVTSFLAEDISMFMSGFDLMNDGLSTADSNLVIKGNVVIQEVLGRKPQFANQQEFDSLMESDEAFIL